MAWVSDPWASLDHHPASNAVFFRVEFMNKRKALFLISKGFCHYCGCGIDIESYQIDHVIPKSKGGISCISNYAAACALCNSAKGNRSIEDFRLHQTVKNSKFSGIINAGQYKKLRSIGELSELNLIKFHFEKINKIHTQ